MKRSISRFVRKYWMFIFAGMIFLGLVLLTYLVLIPKIKDIFDKRQTIESQKSLLANLTTKRRLLDSMSGGDNLRYFDEAQKALPNEKDAAQILIALDNLVQKTQFGISNIEFNPGMISSKSAQIAGAKNTTPDEKNKGSNFLPLKVSGIGETAKFLSFVKELPKLRPLFDISQISLSYQADSKDIVRVDFSLDAFYLLPITTIGGLESTLPELSPIEKITLANLVNMPYLGNLPTENDVNLQLGKSNLFVP